MNKQILVLALSAAFASVASAQSSVTIFGVLDVSLKQVKNGSAGSLKSQGNGDNSSSRLGFRGSEDLGGGLRAEFWLEGDVGVDTGSGGQWGRRSTISLSSASMGELRMGRDYVPTHGVVCVYDPFGCVGPAQVTTFRSQHAVAATAFATGADTLVRANSVVRYYLPQGLGGVFGDLFVSAGEGAATSAGGSSKTRGARLGYAKGAVHVSLATIETVNTSVPGTTFKDSALGGSYDFGIAKVGASYRSYKLGARKAADTMVSLWVPIGAGLFKATLVTANQSGTNSAGASVASNDASLWGLGYDYNLSKRTALYTAVSAISNKSGATYTIAGGPAGIRGGEKSAAYEVGVRHNF